MGAEENKAVIRQWIEARNTNNLEAAVSLWADDFQDRVRQGFTGTTEAFPDVQITMHEIIAEGDKVALHWTMHGTHQGMYQDIPATGKPISWSGMDLYTIANGKIASIVRAADDHSIARQLRGESA